MALVNVVVAEKTSGSYCACGAGLFGWPALGSAARALFLPTAFRVRPTQRGWPSTRRQSHRSDRIHYPDGGGPDGPPGDESGVDESGEGESGGGEPGESGGGESGGGESGGEVSERGGGKSCTTGS